jgi:integrase/recombinase XerD
MSDSILSATSPRSSRIVESPVDGILPQYVNYLRAQRYADDTIQRYLASLTPAVGQIPPGMVTSNSPI